MRISTDIKLSNYEDLTSLFFPVLENTLLGVAEVLITPLFCSLSL